MANVSLRKKALANNKSSLYLDYFPPIVNPKTGKESRREFLGLQVFEKPKDEIEKAHNKSTLEYADLLRAKRLTQIRDKKYGFKENITYNVDFIEFYTSVVEEYYNNGTKSNHSSWNASLNYFKAFAGTSLKSHFLNASHVKKYRIFLLTTNNLRNKKPNKLSINTASSYYKNFIIVLKKAYKEKIIEHNLAEDAEFIKEEETYREYLSEKELEILWNTDCDFPKLKHMAFLSTLTGLRFIDVITLPFCNVYSDIHQGNYIKVREQKTGNLFNHPISENVLNIINLQPKENEFVFGDAKYTEITRPLKKWLSDAGITKKITFHNFRHTYATLQLANGTDIYTVSKLLGHKNVSTTQIYTKVIDQNKIVAANRINLKLDGI
ncbi:tyrosine-type recombinase/integrase [Flavobacterium sp. LS2P90]|uniref:Tyrosine-type recombinase/integrase n=1 Tax=Flavobacterium xylosi TaxID=3230415 RepID=A0ABW6HR48_9FLAO